MFFKIKSIPILNYFSVQQGENKIIISYNLERE